MKNFIWLTFAFVKLLMSQPMATSFIYQTIQGSLMRNSSFDFSVYPENCKGVIFYGIDSNGTILLIEVDGSTFVNIRYHSVNLVGIRQEMINLCGTNDCSKIFMTFLVQLYLSQVTVKCKGKSTLLQLRDSSYTSNLNGYPKPIFNNKNETFVMMGNTGPYQGHGHVVYPAVQDQLNGCLIKFNFNDQVINFIQNGSAFSRLCTNEYNGTLCNGSSCTFQSISYDVNDCSLWALNPRHCNFDIPLFNVANSSYLVNAVNRSDVTFRLDWKSIFPNSYCLLDIKFRNRMNALLHINSTGGLLITVTHQQSIIRQKYVTKISFDTVNILLVNFTYTLFIVKVSSKDRIDSFIDESIGEPISLILGGDSIGGTCKRFEGAMRIQGECLNAVAIPRNNSSSPILQVLIISCALLICISVLGFVVWLTLWISAKVSRSKDDQNVPYESNDYEMNHHIQMKHSITEEDEYFFISP